MTQSEIIDRAIKWVESQSLIRSTILVGSYAGQ